LAHDPTEHVSGPFRLEVTNTQTDIPAPDETAFEKGRGLNQIEIRRGFASARVELDADANPSTRLVALKALSKAAISIDFLKFTHDGFSFVVAESDSQRLIDCLTANNYGHEVITDRCVLMAHAVNMRDEEGMVSRIVSDVIASGVSIEHMGEMHDRLLMLMSREDAEHAVNRLRELHPEVTA